MRTKAKGLCAKSRRTVDGKVFRVIFNIIVRVPELKMLRKHSETERNANSSC